MNCTICNADGLNQHSIEVDAQVQGGPAAAGVHVSPGIGVAKKSRAEATYMGSRERPERHAAEYRRFEEPYNYCGARLHPIRLR